MLKRCNLGRCSADSTSRSDDPIICAASAAAGSFNDLPQEVVSVILTKLVSSSSSSPPCSLADYVRFPAVSTTWRRAFQAQNIFDIKLPAQIPLLVLQTDEDDLNTRYFYSLSSDGGGKLHDFPLRGQLSHQRCRGSSYGWLLTLVPDETHTVRLFNPFSSSEIHLPSLFSLQPSPDNWIGNVKECKYVSCINKAAFSRNPSSYTSNDDNFIVIMVITDKDDLGFCKLGDTRWIPFNSPYRPPGRYRKYISGSRSEGGFDDVIYYNDQFYAVSTTGLVACLDFHQQDYPYFKLTVLDVAHPPPEGMSVTSDWHKKYLVESSGDLLQVHRGVADIDPEILDNNIVQHVPENGHMTVGFQVFKLIDKKWVEIRSLNGWSLFLGDNTSFSVPAHNFPTGCIKPNCIYFTDDYGFHSDIPGAGPLDCGVFNLEDGSFGARSPVETEIIWSLFPHWLQLML